jgi:hypothetical protein
MFMLLQMITLLLVTIALALSLAHALELPGKMRLDRQTYYAVQSIYYPGFTIGGGIGEAGSTLAAIILLFLTPRASADFWWTVVALLGLIALQVVYWLVTHPVNLFWVEGVKLNRVSSGFFSVGANRSRLENETAPDWTELRDRWEYSHVARAGCALVSFIALVIAISAGT